MENEYEHRLTEVETCVKNDHKRLEEVEKRQDDLDELVSTVKVLAVREETVENDVKEIKSDVKALTSKPGRRWDSLVEKVIFGIVAAVVGFLMAQVGF